MGAPGPGPSLSALHPAPTGPRAWQDRGGVGAPGAAFSPCLACGHLWPGTRTRSSLTRGTGDHSRALAGARLPSLLARARHRDSKHKWPAALPGFPRRGFGGGVVAEVRGRPRLRLEARAAEPSWLLGKHGGGGGGGGAGRGGCPPSCLPRAGASGPWAAASGWEPEHTRSPGSVGHMRGHPCSHLPAPALPGTRRQPTAPRATPQASLDSTESSGVGLAPPNHLHLGEQVLLPGTRGLTAGDGGGLDGGRPGSGESQRAGARPQTPLLAPAFSLLCTRDGPEDR